MTDESIICRHAYVRALHGAPEITRVISLAGVRIALRFATMEAERTFFPALAPFETEGAEADEQICIWFGDGAALDARLIPDKLPENPHHYHRVTVEREGFISRYGPVTGVYWLHDIVEHTAYAYYPSRMSLMGHEMSSPLLPCLYFVLKRMGILALHAGAVGTEENASLLVGRGGSGKSSVCLAAMHAGMAFYGDDYVLLTPGNLVYPLYASVKLNQDMARLMSLEECRWFDTDDGRIKHVYLLEKARLCLAPRKVSAVLLCRVEHLPAPQAERCSALRILPELTFSAMQQAFDPDPAVFARLAALLGGTTAHVLSLSDDPGQAAELLKNLLSEAEL